MATVQQRLRRDSAVKLVQKRIDFWTNQQEETVEVDGKQCNVAAKLALAEAEMENLRDNMSRVRSES